LLRQPIDHRVDIFAYGVTALRTSHGQEAVPGETPDDILRKQLDRSDFIPPRELNSDIPFCEEKAILECLERDATSGIRPPVCSCMTCRRHFTCESSVLEVDRPLKGSIFAPHERFCQCLS